MAIYRIACAILVTAFPLVQGRICYECNGVKSVDDCHTTASCDSDFDNCYMDVSGQRGDLTFRLGCRSQAFCASNATMDSSSDVNDSCNECCDSPLCNKGLCAYVGIRSAPNCDANCSDDPSFDCQQVDQVYGICHDIQNSKAVCRKFCGICCLVDGAWSDWSSWGDCSATCGNGTIARRRTCDTPYRPNGGVDCQGASLDLKQCRKQNCATWSEWGIWTVCSASCGGGDTKRYRYCDILGQCQGDAIDFKVCNTHPCGNIGDGQWGPWQPWSHICFTSGMGGTNYRHRNCTYPTNVPHGKVCEGSARDYGRCDRPHVSMYCHLSSRWNEWESWGGCAVTCGGGTREKGRWCLGTNGHVNPVCCRNGSVTVTEDCNTQPCV